MKESKERIYNEIGKAYGHIAEAEQILEDILDEIATDEVSEEE